MQTDLSCGPTVCAQKEMKTVIQTIEDLRSANEIEIIKRSNEGIRKTLFIGNKHFVPIEYWDKEVIDQRYWWSSNPHWELEIK